jgi:subtilisin family serine protease
MRLYALPHRRRVVRASASLAALLTVVGCSSAPPAPATGASSGPSTLAATSSASASASASASPSVSVSTAPAVIQRHPGWALDRIDQRKRALDSRYTVRSQGKGVTVYVVDGLFDVTNAELGGRASVGLKSGTGCGLEDGIDHGLFVAGIIGGRHTGVAKQVRIVSVGAINGCEGGSGDQAAEQTARVVRALRWVAAKGRRPGVVNLSLNVAAPAPTVRAAVRRVVRAGLTVVASAGNNGEDACRYPPAGLPSVVTVAAATRRDRDAGLNHGRCVDLFAPGEAITSVVGADLDPDRLVTSDQTATSWAAPFVSGAAALYLSAHPSATPLEVRRRLIGSATTTALRGNLHGSPDRLLYVGDL